MNDDEEFGKGITTNKDFESQKITSSNAPF
jgi:hypothetical protein